MESKNDKFLKEIIDFSKTELSDLILDDIKLGDFMNDLNINKKESKNTLKLKEKKKSKDLKLKLSYSKKLISKEIIEEENEDIDLSNNDIKNNLILNFENENESIFELGIKYCEKSQEKNQKIIDDIFGFIDNKENNIQKYLLDNKIIEEEKIEDNNNGNNNDESNEIDDLFSEEEEEENEENNDIINTEEKKEKTDNNNNNNKEIKKEETYEIKETINEDNFIIINKNNLKKNSLSANLSKKRPEIDIIINTPEFNLDKTNKNLDNNINNNINTNNYQNTKLILIEQTENLTFMKKKDKNELKQYLNNKTYNNDINNIEGDTEKEKNNNKTIIYDITEFHNLNNLSKEFQKIKISCLFFDEKYIYIGDITGNLLLYNLKEEILLKQFNNPFPNFNKIKLSIKSIYSDQNYIITGYEKGKLALYAKNEKNILKTKLYESFNDITNEDIIETKIYSKKKNVIVIYFSDNKENIHLVKIKKNKIFKNKIYGNIITKPKDTNKLEPFYHIEINPFFYKCIGAVNNKEVSVFVVKKYKKHEIISVPNKDENSFMSFCFSKIEEEKNIFYLSNLNIITIYEINSDYSGASPIDSIQINNENIIQIGFFHNELLYTFTQKNYFKLININKKNSNNNNIFKFQDKIIIENNDIDNTGKTNAEYIINFKNNLSIINGILFFYYNNKIFYLKCLPFDEGLNKLNILNTNNSNLWYALFNIMKQVYINIHPIWKNIENRKFNEICKNYLNSYISYLIIYLGSSKSKEEFNKVNNKFIELINLLIEINFIEFIIKEKDSLYSILSDYNLIDYYYYLLEPFIINDIFVINKGSCVKFLDKKFLENLIKSFLNKNNEYIIPNKSWLSEILLHFPENIILNIEKEIIEKSLINVIIYKIINFNINLNDDIFIDYRTPINIILQLLNEKLCDIDLNNNNLFIKENRYKDEIIFSNDYLRLKLIWYIIYIIKNKILDEKEKTEKNDDKKFKSNFIKEILDIFYDKKNLELIVFNELDGGIKNNEKSFVFNKEIMILFQLILDNADELNKFHEINKDTFFQKIKGILETRKEFVIDLKLFVIKNILKDNITDIGNNEKLNLVIFFMENNCQNSEEYPEIKEIEFEKKLIEILKLIDSFTFDDTEKLLKMVDKCKDNYKELGKYIQLNF